MDLTAFLVAVLLSACLQAANGLLLPANKFIDIALPSYDYIIVGGGVAGLVVANRLTENQNVTVLVLEAGDLDPAPDLITVPGLVGHGFIPSQNWNITTAPQASLDNRTRDYGQGHVVGGGSILNGLVMTRGAKHDYDAWRTLGNPGWSWHGMLHYFKKSENFSTCVTPEDRRRLYIRPHMKVHGKKGPLQVGYPRFFYNSSKNFLEGVSELGIPILHDINAGISAGASIAPATINDRNQSRADSRRAYLDSVLNRPNLHLATQQTVTRILFGAEVVDESSSLPVKGLKRIYGVEFATSADSPRKRVACNKEVILAAGAIISPALLQVSGIGPTPILEELGVPVQIDLPGVGQNLQDHGMVGAFYNYTRPGLFTANNLTGDILEEVEGQYFANRTGPLTHPLISTLAFASLRHLATNWKSLLSNISNSQPESYLPPGPGQHPTILKGYAQQHRLLTSLLSHPTVGALEVMADSIGTLTAAVQHPFSRGFVRALSADLFANGSVAPNILLDPRYCSHPFDCDILVRGLKLNNQLVKTKAMQQLIPQPSYPWDDSTAQNDTALLEAIHSKIQTEFHPAGSTSMLPLDLGGVVSPRLVVYGTSNLRVVDAGIIPLLPAAHIQAAVYAIAEKAGDMIKQDSTDREPNPNEGEATPPPPNPFTNGPPGLGPGIVQGPGVGGGFHGDHGHPH
ncbi:GMC oxidoreductase-domain-containing protein [Apiosordaria backusii]|uniref:GMC oxidoreductase-domain-containing protein n=1 Tax=Apiosordaria backusii TaxID=314023 RepID=A0AA40DQA0_9PEZI|nr:GMC oxidoreductase-domain-containing protein [Apiosordaria backusii]